MVPLHSLVDGVMIKNTCHRKEGDVLRTQYLIRSTNPMCCFAHNMKTMDLYPTLDFINHGLHDV